MGGLAGFSGSLRFGGPLGLDAKSLLPDSPLLGHWGSTEAYLLWLLGLRAHRCFILPVSLGRGCRGYKEGQTLPPASRSTGVIAQNAQW